MSTHRDLPADVRVRMALIAVNVLGPFRLSRVIGGSMALRERGTIVHVSSDAAVNAYPNWGAYSVSNLPNGARVQASNQRRYPRHGRTMENFGGGPAGQLPAVLA